MWLGPKKVIVNLVVSSSAIGIQALNVKTGDLVRCKKQLLCVKNVARPISTVRGYPCGPIIDAGTLGIVIHGQLGSSDFVRVLVGDRTYAMCAKHLSVVQSYEECRAT